MDFTPVNQPVPRAVSPCCKVDVIRNATGYHCAHCGISLHDTTYQDL